MTIRFGSHFIGGSWPTVYSYDFNFTVNGQLVQSGDDINPFVTYAPSAWNQSVHLLLLGGLASSSQNLASIPSPHTLYFMSIYNKVS